VTKKDVFVVFPYLKTTEPVVLRGILFRSSNDLEGLSPEQQSHLKTLFAMFFLRNSLRIKRMIYAHIELSEDHEMNRDLQQRLYEAQTLINYLYSTPHPTMGDPFLHREHASLYTFTTAKVHSSSIWPEDHPQIDYNVENVPEEDVPRHQYIDGYDGMLNGRLVFWVIPSSRIYAPVPHLSLNISQNLYWDLEQFTEKAKHWAWVDFLRGRKYKNEELEERLFTSIEWYNRSTTEDVDEEEVLLDIAVAFESLLNLENNDKLTARFRETVMILLGSTPRLDSWTEQFYNARSSVAHKGKAQHYMFYAMDWDKNRLPNVYSGKDTKALPYRSLTTYGRRIFRLCLTVMLSNARIAEDDGLSSLFVHNQERLEMIRQQLKQTSESPEKRLNSIAEAVGDLHGHHWSSQELIPSELLVTVGRLVIEAYLETKPQFSEEVERLVQETLQQLRQQDISIDEKLHLFQRIIMVLRQNNSVMDPSLLGTQQPLTIVLSLLNYLESPGFLTRKWMP
jgi:hypothetical protein